MGTNYLPILTKISILIVYTQVSFAQNPSAPRFARDRYDVNTLEGLPIGSLIVTLSASDGDSGAAGQLDFSIQDNPWYQINNTGALKVKSVIDAENPAVPRQLVYIVTATDRGSPSRTGTATLSIAIGDDNEARPEFKKELYLANIYDGDPIGTFVVQVEATDRDRDAVITYDIPDVSDYFQIDANNGNVTTKVQVDYDAILADQGKQRFTLSVRARDGLFLQIGPVLVTINRKNHIAPEFEKTVYEVSVDEGESDVVLTTVKATDDKETPVQRVYYGIHEPAIPGYLTVARFNGRVTLKTALDREALTGGKIEQLITARDDGDPLPVLTSTATLIITVNDINDNIPEYSQDTYRLVLPQEYKTSQQYSLPTATDADIGENARIVYQLSPEAQRYFTVNADTSVLTPRANCGRECVRVEDCTWGTVTVYAFNDGLPLLNDTLQVEIVLTTPNSAPGAPPSGLIACSQARTPNDNDPVFDSSSYTGEIPENSPANTPVLTITATDNDFGDSGDVTYSINSPFFGVNDSGVVFTKQSFDYETLTDKRICVDVVATDNGQPSRSATAQVCITVTNLNDNRPSFPNAAYAATVKDGDPANSHVITLTANDADGPDDVTYEIVGSNPYFTIDTDTGRITLAQTMNRADILNGVTGQVIDLRVRANNAPFSAETTLKVSIESSNKFAPVFSTSTVNLQVPEGQTGTILTITATDQDTPSQTIRYQFANSAFNGIFSMDPTSGEFRVTSDIDRENLPLALLTGSASVQVLATDNGQPLPKTGTATVNIEIIDINDNVPQFGQTSFEIRLFENFTPGQEFQLPNATDADIGSNARIVYEVAAGAQTTFTVVGNKLTTSRTCDRSCVKTQDCALQSFSVWAYNPDRPNERSELTVYVSLLKQGSTRPVTAPPTGLTNCSSVPSANDNDPKFSRDLYEVSLREDVLIGSTVLRVSATDDDFGNSGVVTYTTNSSVFIINDNGEISTTRDLDYENPADRRTCIQVVATDKGTPPRTSSAIVCVDLVDVNDNRPTFTSTQFTGDVNDRDPTGTFVVQISATDRDSGSRISYDFPQSNEYFQIDSVSGNVTVKKTIDISAILQNFPNGEVGITVRASDGQFPVTTQLRVTIKAVNHHAPVFKERIYNADIDEGRSNVIVARVTADDDDVPKQQILYSVRNSTLPNIFTIDSSGQVRLVQALDRETLARGFVEAVIVARDGGQPPPERSATATLRLQVNDVNDNIPQFPTDSYDMNIFMNFTSGQNFQLPRATDADVSDTVVYALSDNAKQFFTMDTATGVVTTRTDCGPSCVKLADCDYMTFTVTAFNPGSPQRNDTLRVKLKLLTMSSLRTTPSAVRACSDTNSPNMNEPTFSEDLYEGSVNEGVPPRTVVFTVNATDADWGNSGEVSYTITNSTLFTINSNGQISTTRDLDYENPADRQTCMQIVATDKGTPPLSASTVVCLQLININDNRPIFPSAKYTGLVKDREPAGTFVTQISATDNDFGATITHGFNQVNEYFQIDPRSGNVTVKKTIDRPAILSIFPNAVVLVNVTATDGQFPVTTQLEVTIQAVNHFAPEFTLTFFNASIDEGIANVVVARPKANDADRPQQRITYSILNSTIPNIFSIDPSNGEISLIRALDRETQTLGYVETVILAQDSGQPPPAKTATATLRLHVNDVNDNIPQFPTDTYDLNIFMNYSSGDGFALPKATDPDITDTIVYELSNDARQFFSLDTSTGVVTTLGNCGPSCVKLADCEYMTFTLSAYNPGSPLFRDTLTVRLKLLALNEIRTPVSAVRPCTDTNSPNNNDPKFTKDLYEGSVTEGVPGGTVVVTVNSSDADWGNSGQVTYTITNSTDFTINDKGEISTRRDLDYENPADRRICIQVKATDKGTPARSASTVVCVDLINSNEHRPTFISTQFTGVVRDRDPAGTFVVRISATDNDAEAVITYRFPQVNEYFQINPNTGNVTVKKAIDRPDILLTFPSSVVVLNTTATDGQFSVTTELRITVEAVNHYSPEFTQTIYTANVSEGITNVIVFRPTANDADIPRQQLTYSIINSTLPGIFSVNPNNGQVRLVQALDRETLTQGFVEAVIRARDGGQPPPERSATATLRLQVNDVNDNIPQFPVNNHDLNIFMNFTSGQSFALPKATDADVSDTVVYEFSDNAKQFFTLNTATGAVTTRTDCGASCVKISDCEYMTFTLSAYNPGSPEQRGTLSVKVTLWALSNTRTPPSAIKACSDENSPNNNDPKFTKDLYEGSVTEGVPGGTVVVTVNSSDADWGNSGQVTYTITNSTDFTINDKGEISTRRDLDYENPADRRICMQVNATDKGTPPRSDSTVVCVNLINSNEHRPTFISTQFTGAVRDRDPAGTFVVRISATDNDAEAVITYSFPQVNEYFQINPNTGNVTVKTAIDRPDILLSFPSSVVVLNVTATDGQFSVNTELRISIEAVNHYSPEFTQTIYTANVSEGITNVIVFRPTANDADLPKQQLTYSLMNSTLPGIFSVNPNNGQARLVQALDRETLTRGFVEAVIVARDGGQPPPERSATATLRLQVNDVNDNIPQFPENYDLNIFMNFTSGQSFALPEATDADVSDTVVYEFSDNAKQFFTLNTATGAVTTRTDCGASCVKISDCEYMTFTLSAYNPGSPEQRGTLSVKVTLWALSNTRTPASAIKACSDANSPNNNDPKFTKDLYEGSVTEGVPGGTVVVTVNSSDADWGNSGQVTYTITNSTDFTINDKGEISTRRDLDYENPADRRICMQVNATDKGTPPRSDSTVVCVDLINSNEHRPTFFSTQFTGVVRDRDPAGTFVVRISATDNDAEAVITYSFPQLNEYFQINPNTGNVTVRKAIDRPDILQSFPSSVVTINVTASDGQFSVTTHLQVTIEGVNHYAPVFTQTVYNASVNESVSNVVVARLTANDDDIPKQQITYSIFNSTLPNIFSIDANGQVRLTRALDRETLTQGFVEAVILARDSGQPPPAKTATATLRLQVNDINDNIPQFPSDSYNLNIFMNFTSGKMFQLPKATDADVTDTIVYELSDNAKQFFSLNSDTGAVTTLTNCGASCVKLSDCEYMTFTFWAYNPGSPQQRDALTVKVILLSLTDTRTPISAIRACSDANSPNNNDPKFTKDLYEGSVTEGVPGGTVVVTVNSSDADWGNSGQVTYTITNSTDFTINDKGEISTRRDLDYENPADRRICMEVKATDKGTPPRSDSTVVCVDLINSNEHRPTFISTQFTGAVRDRDPAGTFVVRISATDNDAEAVITYSFPQVNEYFQINPNTGNVTVKKAIDRPDILLTFPSSVLVLNVTATDGQLSVTTRLQVTIEGVNHYAPVFTQTVYNANVNEGVSNVVVARLTANDDDIPKQQITYSIFNSTLPNIFSIDANGQVRLTRALDRETLTQGFVEAVILARDSGQPPPAKTATATLRLQVNDINDNIPQFPSDSYNLNIFMNFTSGQSFVLPRATDADVTDTIVYELSDNAKQFFSLNSGTGAVTTLTNCGASCVKLSDCEYMTFTLWAYNPGTPQQRDALTVKVTLLSMADTRTPVSAIRACSDANSPNNNYPKFTKDLYEGSVTEGVPGGTVVVTVNSSDADWGNSGQVTYTITNSTDFTINDKGEISTRRDLDYENPADRRICMEVKATDKGTPPRSASTVVCVDVTNKNEHGPSFGTGTVRASVRDRDIVGTLVTQVVATDRDSGATIRYELVGQNDFFQIDAASGNVTVKRTIDRDIIVQTTGSDVLTLTVRASDGQFEDSTQVQITIGKNNIFPPRFDQDVFTVSVREETVVNPLITLTATDEDDSTETITYRIINNTNIFSIDSTSGTITMNSGIDRETLPSGVINILIEATDSGIPPPIRSSTATVRITVIDVNDNAPTFNTTVYDIQIYQNFTTGTEFPLPTASDPDADSRIVYTIDPSDPWFEVDPDSGKLKVRADCGDNCTKIEDCYYGEVTVWAYNPDRPTIRASMKVRITMLSTSPDKIVSSSNVLPLCSEAKSLNKHSPIFSEPIYTGSVAEDEKRNTVVVTVSATDEDWGDNGQLFYNITNSTDFGVNENGQIYIAKPLDYEKNKRICMQVIATDRGAPPQSASTLVCVDISDVNDNKPVFEAFGEVTVLDGSQVGTWVTKVIARDADAGTKITYDLETPNTYFQIDPTSGNITVSKTISRADIIASRGADVVSLKVRASDSANTQTATMRIQITSLNDHAPRFTRDQYTASVDEETSNVKVTTVEATDDDLPKTTVNLYLQPSNFSEYFEINRVSGEITLVRPIDRESLDENTIQLVVIAVDSGNPPPRRSSSVTVLVQINDINDNAPYFNTEFTEITMFQNFSGGVIHQLPQAFDADTGPNAQIGYRLSQDADFYFNLDENTNTLSTKQNCPDCIQNGDYKWLVFKVTAFNRDRPDLRAQLQVTVFLLDIGDVEPPKVLERVFSETVYVDRGSAKVFQQVFFVGDVTGESATNYTLAADNLTLSMFAVTDTGVVVLSDIPTSTQKTYSMKINAYKAGKNMTVNLLVLFTDEPALGEEGIAAISAISAIVLLIIILVIVHIIWWKTRHKKDKDEAMFQEEGPCRGCCCGKPLIAVPIKFNGESSL